MLRQQTRRSGIAVLAVLLAAAPVGAKGLADNLSRGAVELQSAGPLAFGPEGILFIGDPLGAAVFAIETTDTKGSTIADVQAAKLDSKIADLLGTTPKGILVNDIAVHPLSGSVYVSVSRGRGPDAQPVILRLEPSGSLREVNLKDVKFAKAALAKPVEGKKRQEVITGIKYLDGKVYVAGLSNEEFASTLRSIPFPFTEKGNVAGVGIYHGSHGRFETASPVRTFTPYEINGQAHLLAAYTCTPLVKIPVAELKDGAKVKGTTIAELGNHNRPLDIVVYQKDGKDYLLIANNSRGVMKVSTEGIGSIEPITARVKDTAGLKYETVAGLKGVEQLDRLDATRAVLLVRNADGLNLQTIPLP